MAKTEACDEQLQPAAKKILIIEDEHALRELLAELFTNLGFLVTQTDNGEEGLLLALSFHPDLILLDLLLPGINGLAMLEKLFKQYEWANEMQVIILSNLSDQQNKAQARELGVYDFLTKTDLHLKDIVAKAKEAIAMSGQLKAAKKAQPDSGQGSVGSKK